MDNISDIRYCAVPPWPGDTDTGYRHIALSRVLHNQTKWDREVGEIINLPNLSSNLICVQLVHESGVILLQCNGKVELRSRD